MPATKVAGLDTTIVGYSNDISQVKSVVELYWERFPNSAVTVTTTDTGGTSGTAAAYSLGLTVGTPTAAAMTISAPSGGDVQLLSVLFAFLMRKISLESLFTNKEPVIDAEPVTSKDPVMIGENNLINIFCYKYYTNDPDLQAPFIHI